MQNQQRSRDLLEYSHCLDLDNPLGRMMKESALADALSALEEIADFPSECIVAELVSGRQEVYSLFVVDKTPSLLRMINDTLWLDILLPPAYLSAFLSLPSADEEPEYYFRQKEELLSRMKRRTEKYSEVLERSGFEFNSVTQALLPDEVRERVYVGII